MVLAGHLPFQASTEGTCTNARLAVPVFEINTLPFVVTASVYGALDQVLTIITADTARRTTLVEFILKNARVRLDREETIGDRNGKFSFVFKVSRNKPKYILKKLCLVIRSKLQNPLIAAHEVAAGDRLLRRYRLTDVVLTPQKIALVRVAFVKRRAVIA